MLIANAVEKIIGRSPFLDEALNDELINVSALARKIRPEVESMTRKNVRESAIIMAINRRPADKRFKVGKSFRLFMNALGDIIVRSGLSDHTFENSPGLGKCQRRLIDGLSQENEVFYTFSKGVYETTLVASSSLDGKINEVFGGEKLISYKSGLSSVTLRLPKDNTEISGVYYYFLKQLAWAGINVCEVISTSNEISLVVSENDVNHAFPLLMKLKQQS